MGWQDSTGTPGRIRPEWVAGFNRNLQFMIIKKMEKKVFDVFAVCIFRSVSGVL
ncbi:MAG: hypothetical protein JXN62_00095 [Bacteroidales bacterium]|nr:hypothetical protein [Bacteroidales bacterium]